MTSHTAVSCVCNNFAKKALVLNLLADQGKWISVILPVSIFVSERSDEYDPWVQDINEPYRQHVKY